MKNILFSCAIAVAGLTMPLTADNYNCCGPQFDNNCCMPQCCDQGFDGFYVGGNLGVFSHVAHRADFDFFSGGSNDLSYSTIDTSFTAGLQVGYDWQCCSKVFGLVVDWNWVDTDHNHRLTQAGVTDRFNRRDRSNWFTTIRGRFGVAVCDALLYVTAGAVVVDTKNRWDDVILSASHRHSHNRWGWVAGVGAEFLVWCNWSAGVEVLFMHFDEKTTRFTVPDSTPSTYRFGHSDSAYVARFIVNYRFGDLFGGCGCW